MRNDMSITFLQQILSSKLFCLLLLGQKSKRNDMFTIFLQQIINSRLLLVVIVGLRK